MDTNELRLGNLVYFKFIGKYVNILGLNAYETPKGIEYKISCKEGINLYCEPLSVLSPIEITEEILLKFGFAKIRQANDNSSYIISLNSKRTLQINELDNAHAWLCDDFTTIFKEYVFLSQPKYLHELQNLYFTLTGSELVFSTEP